MSRMLYITDLDGTLVRSVFTKADYEVNHRLVCTLQFLKQHADIGLVTSASKNTCLNVLKAVGLETFFDCVITAQDVDFIKPHPEGYLTCMAYFDAKPECTVVFEDSRGGLESARGAGAHVCMVVW